MADRHDAPEDGDAGDALAEPIEARFRPLDRRRIQQIRKWLEGTRVDAPTREELEEFVLWVSLEIEGHLARHQPVQDLVGLLNAARAQLPERGPSRG